MSTKLEFKLQSLTSESPDLYIDSHTMHYGFDPYQIPNNAETEEDEIGPWFNVLSPKLLPIQQNSTLNKPDRRTSLNILKVEPKINSKHSLNSKSFAQARENSPVKDVKAIKIELEAPIDKCEFNNEFLKKRVASSVSKIGLVDLETPLQKRSNSKPMLIVSNGEDRPVPSSTVNFGKRTISLSPKNGFSSVKKPQIDFETNLSLKNQKRVQYENSFTEKLSSYHLASSAVIKPVRDLKIRTSGNSMTLRPKEPSSKKLGRSRDIHTAGIKDEAKTIYIPISSPVRKLIQASKDTNSSSEEQNGFIQPIKLQIQQIHGLGSYHSKVETKREEKPEVDNLKDKMKILKRIRKNNQLLTLSTSRSHKTDNDSEPRSAKDTRRKKSYIPIDNIKIESLYKEAVETHRTEGMEELSSGRIQLIAGNESNSLELLSRGASSQILFKKSYESYSADFNKPISRLGKTDTATNDQQETLYAKVESKDSYNPQAEKLKSIVLNKSSCKNSARTAIQNASKVNNSSQVPIYGKEFFAKSSYGKNIQQKFVDSPKPQNLVGMSVLSQQKQYQKVELVSRTPLNVEKSGRIFKKPTLEVQAALLQGRAMQRHLKILKSNFIV